MKRMLIAEDSDLRDMFRELFAASFEVVTAQNEGEAGDKIASEPKFDVAIIDVIMPVENPADDEDETGLRIMKRLIDTGKCRNFVVLSVRWDVAERVRAIAAGKAQAVVLSKRETDPDDLIKHVSQLTANP
jgi:CheY-like chemotaxis protein